jgi:hypothetical protein
MRARTSARCALAGELSDRSERRRVHGRIVALKWFPRQRIGRARVVRGRGLVRAGRDAGLTTRRAGGEIGASEKRRFEEGVAKKMVSRATSSKELRS